MVENVEIERFYARLFRQNERVMKLGLAAIEDHIRFVNRYQGFGIGISSLRGRMARGK